MAYNLKNIQQLLNEIFNEQELRDFCFLDPDFRPVYDQLRDEDRKPKILSLLLDYARRKDLLERILVRAKAENPAKYQEYQPYLFPDLPDLQPREPASPEPSPVQRRLLSVSEQTSLIQTDDGQPSHLPKNQSLKKKTLVDYLRDPLWQGVSVFLAVVGLGWGIYTFYVDGPPDSVAPPTPTTPPLAASSPTVGPDPICQAGIAPALEALDKMVFIPATDFIMGDNQGDRPKHNVSVAAFWMDRFEVTNLQYQAFISATGHLTPAEWEGLSFPSNQTAFQPVVNVTWTDAKDYCVWADKRLPTETEWELACRGPEEDYFYPWGQELDTHKSNSMENSCGKPQTVGSYSPAGDSVYGTTDMVGNVFEWVNTIYQPYPYLNDDRENLSDTESPRVYRGGSWQTGQIGDRCTVRSESLIEFSLPDLGFRCAKASP